MKLVKATMIQMIGVTATQHIWIDLESIKNASYAQYNHTLQYLFKKKGSRTMLRKVAIEKTVVLMGWLDVPVQDLNGYVAYQTKHKEIGEFLAKNEDKLIAKVEEAYDMPIILENYVEIKLVK